jgi:hypothetical protein
MLATTTAVAAMQPLARRLQAALGAIWVRGEDIREYM